MPIALAQEPGYWVCGADAPEVNGRYFLCDDVSFAYVKRTHKFSHVLPNRSLAGHCMATARSLNASCGGLKEKHFLFFDAIHQPTAQWELCKPRTVLAVIARFSHAHHRCSVPQTPTMGRSRRSPRTIRRRAIRATWCHPSSHRCGITQPWQTARRRAATALTIPRRSRVDDLFLCTSRSC